MPRAKRINIPNGWYHVFNRGISRKTVCFSEFHFNIFVGLLKELLSRYEIETHAFCMMKNHYHLLLHAPLGNLSSGMWYFGKQFASAVNSDINGDGPLFRSRFKSILIQDDRYLIQVSRYIHLNPVAADLVKNPKDYTWSSCKNYLDDIRKLKNKSPVITNFILSHFKSKTEYEDFLNIGNSASMQNFYRRNNTPSILANHSL